ncbi:hypothetical protein HanRHA438_Chr13g0581431 [Helianthus annuus]|nr:hypothetical protein HanRHA438_Chr13g0581431 [Helianthus annuus]
MPLSTATTVAAVIRCQTPNANHQSVATCGGSLPLLAVRRHQMVVVGRFFNRERVE